MKEIAMQLRPLGKTGFNVTPICVGTSALGSFPAQYGYEVTADQALATLRAAFDGPFNFIDTSNEYGNGGDSERRIGRAMAERGGLPKGFVLATKVDPLVGSNDFSGDRVKRSVSESLERLGLDRLQLVYLHDPEKISFEAGVAKGGPVEALVKLRNEGVIERLGVAGGPIDLMLRYLATDLFEGVISHNRYTLVDQSAEPLIEDARRRNVGFVNAAPFGGGMLVKGPDLQPKYCYAPASEATLGRVRKMERLCKARDVPLAAAALQFSLRDERIASTVVGMSEPQRIAQTVKLANWPIPDDLWSDLQKLAAEGRQGVV
jgi:D-threo-aldose 1-dehydrogenase